MRKMIFATAAILPVLGGAALAQSPNTNYGDRTQLGPMAWPDAAAEWSRLEQNSVAQPAPGATPEMQQLNGTEPPALGQPEPARPTGNE
jgi:hypothetical protein